MLMTTIVIFGFVILLGIYLLTYILQNKETPKGIVLIHGPLGITGIILLIIGLFIYAPHPITSLILFIIAAIGGGILILRDLCFKKVPKWAVVGHGLLGILGFIFLFQYLFNF